MPVSQTRGEVRAQPPLEGSAQQQACRGLGNTLVSYKCMQFNSFFWCHQKGAATSCSRFPPDLFSPRNGQSWSNSPPLYHFHALKKSFFFFCLFRAKPTAYGSSQARGQITVTAAGLYHSSEQCQILNPLIEARD